MHALIVTTMIFGWLIFAFAIPAIIAGMFIVLGTAEPWGLAVPVLVASLGWVLTRIDFKEKRWRGTLGSLMISWTILGIFIVFLIVSRTDSLSLAIWVIPPAACTGLAGVLIMLSGPEKQNTGNKRLLPRLPR